MKVYPPNERIEKWLALLLRGGVTLALALLITGFVVSFATNRSWIGVTDLNELLSGGVSLRADPPRNLAQLDFVQSAVLILIFLPAFRVAFLLGSFARQRDLAFTVIAALVLILMSAGTFFELTR